MTQKESPTEVFKRALAHAARSLAEQPDLEVVFSGDGPSLNGHRAVLPHPPRELSGPETTRIRGLADQLALRVAHHDDAIHGRARPKSMASRSMMRSSRRASRRSGPMR
jgi:cobaltochelatase CobT